MRSIVGSVGGGNDFLELLKSIAILRDPRVAQILSGMAGNVNVQVSPEAMREIEKTVEEFASAKPCPKCLEKAMKELGGESIEPQAGEG